MTTDEKTMIEHELDLIERRRAVEAQLAESREKRRSTPKPTAALEAAQKAYDEAQEDMERLEQEKADAESRLTRLNASLDAGDESVSVDDLMTAEKAIERADQLIRPATQTVQRAERELMPLRSDEHLAHLAADALETINDVPVVICKVPDEAPEVEPLVIVSQTRATEAYGTLDASGEVQLTCKGADIDQKALIEALEATGSEVTISGNRVAFKQARWPLPRLSNPSPGAVRAYMDDFGRAWHAHISDAAQTARMRAAGYHQVRDNGWNGLFRQKSIDLCAENGKAVAAATFLVAAQNGLEDLSEHGLRGELTKLMDSFLTESVGSQTSAGEIVNVTLSDTKTGDDRVWEDREIEFHLGSPVRPITLEVVADVELRYEEAV